MIRRIMLTLFILLMCGVCHTDTVEDAKNRASIASVTDAVTTLIGLSNGAKDLNPIIGSNPGMVLPITAFKFFLIDNITSSDDPDNIKENKFITLDK